MAYVLDLVVILIFAFMVFRGYKAGLIKTVIGLVGMILAVGLAVALSAPIANGVYDGYVREPVEGAITESIKGISNEISGDASLDQMLLAAQDDMPAYVTSLLESHDISLADFAQDVEGDIAKTAPTVAAKVTEQVVKPIVLTVVRSIVGTVLAIVLLIAVALLARIVSKMVRVTPLNKVNAIGGAVCGALKGALWMLIAVTIIQIIVSFASADAAINSKTLEDSLIVDLIADVNPIYNQGSAMLKSVGAAR